jgi:branched-chain amino acid transport system substrate-binding protein
MIVKEVSYEVSEPTVDSLIVTLQGAGADTLLIAATPKFAAQAIRKIYDLGWSPVRYLSNVSASITSVIKPAGLDASKGVMTGYYMKDSTDPRWNDDAGMKEFKAFVGKYMAAGDLNNSNTVLGYSVAATLLQALKQCGADLSRENIMKQAADLKNLEIPTLLPGIKINTSPDNYYPIRQLQMATFNGSSWELFGELISA